VSQENVEIVQRALQAWNRRDLDGALADMHPRAEVDWSESRGLQRGVFRGREQIKHFYEEWLDVFDQVDIEPQDLLDAGEHVVVPNRSFARGRQGVAVTTNSIQVFSMREGKIVRLRLYQDRNTALKAVGLEQ
jgi:ketosteroid isomerase-like protein